MQQQAKPLIAAKQASALEKVAGSTATVVGAGVLSIVSGGFAALLPSLFDSLARGRQMARIEESIRELEAGLNAMDQRVQSLTDDQYKVVAESTAAMYSTVDPEKLSILRLAALQAVQRPEAVKGNSDAIGRLLRDLSTSEVRFLIKYRKCSGVGLGKEEIRTDGRLIIQAGGTEEIAMSGLISLGLLYARSATWDAQMYEWSPLVAKLVELLQQE